MPKENTQIDIEISGSENEVTQSDLDKIEDNVENALEEHSEHIEEIVEENNEDIFEGIKTWLEETLIQPMGQTLATLTDSLAHLNTRMDHLEKMEQQEMTDKLMDETLPVSTHSEMMNTPETIAEISSETKTEALEESEEENPVAEAVEILDKPGREIIRL